MHKISFFPPGYTVKLPDNFFINDLADFESGGEFLMDLIVAMGDYHYSETVLSKFTLNHTTTAERMAYPNPTKVAFVRVIKTH